MKLFFVSFLLTIAATSVEGENCRRLSVCGEGENPFSDPIAPSNPVERGKAGPKGSKGEKGESSEEDVSRRVGDLEERVTLVIGQMNGQITTQDDKIKKLKEALAIQAEKVEALTNFTLAYSKSLSNKFEQLEKSMSNQNNQIETNSEEAKTNSDCLLPHIQHLSRHLPRETAHSSSVQLSCDGSFAAYGVTYRSCRNGRWSPDFDSHRFDCKELLSASWDEAKKTCKDLGLDLLSEGIETDEKRRSLCRKYGAEDFLMTGIVKVDGEWWFPDGRGRDGFHFHWRSGYPAYGGEGQVLMVHCYRNSEFGEIFYLYKSYSNYFLCQN